MNSGLSIPLRIEGTACRTREGGERGITIVLAGLTLIPWEWLNLAGVIVGNGERIALMIRVPELTKQYGLDPEWLRANVRKEEKEKFSWYEHGHRWAAPVGSTEAREMERVAKSLAK